MSIHSDSLHSETMHLRAKAARAEAALAAEHLRSALLDFIVTPACCPGDAPLVASVINWLRPSSLPFGPVGGLAMPDISSFMARRSDGVRDQYLRFVDSKKAAMDLTDAAQRLSYKTTLP